MSATTPPEQTHESCVPTWYGQHLERATVLNAAHIATVNAALVGIQALVDVLHDRESQRAAGEATHCPTKNMGLLAAVHSLTTLVQLHIAEGASDEPAFIRDSQGLQDLSSVTYSHALRRDVTAGKTAEWAQHQRNLQPNQPQTHTQQAQAASKSVAIKGAQHERHQPQ